jgi:DNA-binding FrmR family transcriptional regulator
MHDDKKTAVDRRLKSIEGHVRGIQRMSDEDVYCMDILQQIRAVQSALERTAQLILEDHLNHCVVNAVRSGEPKEQERVIGEIMEVFQATANSRG